jgi:hypothetical protein
LIATRKKKKVPLLLVALLRAGEREVQARWHQLIAWDQAEGEPSAHEERVTIAYTTLDSGLSEGRAMTASKIMEGIQVTETTHLGDLGASEEGLKTVLIRDPISVEAFQDGG